MERVARRQFLSALTAIASLGSSLCVGATVPDDAAPHARIQHLIKRLASRKYRDREAATKELENCGTAAVPALRRVLATTHDAEVRSRARRILATIERSHQPLFRCLLGHTNTVGCVAFSADGRRLATGSDDGTVRGWDVQTGHALWRSRDPLDWVRGIAWMPSGQQIVSASWDHTIRVWDAAKGTQVEQLPRQSQPVRTVAVSQDGRFIVWGGNDKQVHLWDRTAGHAIHRFAQQSDIVNGVALSRDGRWLAAVTGTGEGDVHIYDLRSGKEIGHFSVRASNPIGVDFSPDGRMILCVAGPEVACLWDVLTAKTMRSFANPHGYQGYPIRAAAISPNGKHVLTAHTAGKLLVWDARTGEMLTSLIGHKAAVTTVACSPDGHYAASGGDDRTVRIWRLPRAS